MHKLIVNITCLVVLFFAGINASAQDTTQVPKKVWKQDTIIRGDFDFFHVDMIGNVYTIKGDVINKFNSYGDTLFTQSIKFFGEITALDVGQSFKPVLFFRDQQALVYLDNTLSKNSEIALEEKNLYLVELVALSYSQNTTWMFDQSNSALIKMDVNLNEVARIDNLAQQLNQEIHPTFLQEFNDKLYMNNPEEGILVFDLFGTFLNILPIKNATYMDVDNNNVYYVKDNQLNVYNQKTFEETKIEVPVDSLKGFGVSKNKFYFHDQDGVKIFVR